MRVLVVTVVVAASTCLRRTGTAPLAATRTLSTTATFRSRVRARSSANWSPRPPPWTARPRSTCAAPTRAAPRRSFSNWSISAAAAAVSTWSVSDRSPSRISCARVSSRRPPICLRSRWTRRRRRRPCLILPFLLRVLLILHQPRPLHQLRLVPPRCRPHHRRRHQCPHAPPWRRCRDGAPKRRPTRSPALSARDARRRRSHCSLRSVCFCVSHTC
jgi:hypothetical protein